MHELFEQNIFPIVICNGFCGIGKADTKQKDIPYFFAQTFDSKKNTSFQPQHYFPLEDFFKNNKDHTLISSSTTPSKEDFIDLIHQFQKDPILEKVVLARIKTLTFDEPFNYKEILSILLKRFEKETIFAYIESDHHAFFGSTPENLYIRKNNKIIVDAIAGTALYKNQETLFSQKNIKEHLFVTKMIEKELQDIAKDITTSKPRAKKAGHLCHIHKTVEATLFENVTDEQIIEKLHPTPATCGYPKKEALSFIQNHEPMLRDFYAGPIGWVGDKYACLKVALRCGLLDNDTILLFAGAGIIKESDPNKEIEEINNKFCTLKEALYETAIA